MSLCKWSNSGLKHLVDEGAICFTLYFCSFRCVGWPDAVLRCQVPSRALLVVWYSSYWWRKQTWEGFSLKDRPSFIKAITLKFINNSNILLIFFPEFSEVVFHGVSVYEIRCLCNTLLVKVIVFQCVIGLPTNDFMLMPQFKCIKAVHCSFLMKIVFVC